MLFPQAQRTVLNETATSATPGFSASDGQYSVNAVSLRVGAAWELLPRELHEHL
jgi:hypothetical protein